MKHPTISRFFFLNTFFFSNFSVQILAEEAHSLDAFDVNEAKKALEEAVSLVNAAGDDAAKAEAQIAVEVADALVKALA
jgi:F0F1-type ATP synthase epsilon subunit